MSQFFDSSFYWKLGYETSFTALVDFLAFMDPSSWFKIHNFGTNFRISPKASLAHIGQVFVSHN